MRRFAKASSKEEVDVAFRALAENINRSKAQEELAHNMAGLTPVTASVEGSLVRLRASRELVAKVRSILGGAATVGLRLDFERLPAEVQAKIEKPSAVASRGLPREQSLNRRLVCEQDVELVFIARAKFGEIRLDFPLLRGPIAEQVRIDVGCER
jgi:hypothetical protein